MLGACPRAAARQSGSASPTRWPACAVSSTQLAIACNRCAALGGLGLQQSELAEACAVVAAEHQMVDDRAIERFGGAGEAPSGSAVTVARSGIAAGMIVREDNARGAVVRGIGDDRAEREIGAGFVAGVARQVQAARVIVEVGDPQAFAGGVRIGDAAREEGARGGKTVELQRRFGTLVSHAQAVPDRAQDRQRNRV